MSTICSPSRCSIFSRDTVMLRKAGLTRCWVCCLLNNFHSSHMSCAALSLIHLSPHLHRILPLLPHCCLSFNVWTSTTAPGQQGHCLADSPNNLTQQIMSPTLSLKWAVKPAPIVLPSRRCSLKSNADDLATTLACDRSDVGRLFSPLCFHRSER